MRKLLYPLIASALITIVPFLLTFEKGQNIVRGLFGYEEFALLLLLPLAKKMYARSVGRRKTVLFCTVAGVLYAIVLVAWFDLQNLLSIKGWAMGWYGLLPFFTCALAIAMVWKSPAFSLNGFAFVMFVALMAHLFSLNNYAAQPLAQFPLVDYLERTAPKPPQRKHLSDDWAKKYTVTDSVTVTREYIDSSRSNVVILVESWGVPLDTARFTSELKKFEGVPQTVGIHNRMYSRTRTAEREDLMLKFVTDSSTRRRDTTFLPAVFANMGFSTHFLFGGDSLEHWRYKYIRNIGFKEVVYGKGLDDAEMVTKLDSILQDTASRHFVAWTTLDTKFPLQGFGSIYGADAAAVDSAYSERLAGTLQLVASLATKHSDVRFIVQGDHNPILSPVAFHEKFYKRWVPYVILN